MVGPCGLEGGALLIEPEGKFTLLVDAETTGETAGPIELTQDVRQRLVEDDEASVLAPNLRQVR